MKRIETQKELDRVLKSAGEPVEFFIRLTGGLRSSKLISLDEKGNYYILNEIDDSEDYVEHDELMRSTHVGEAIGKGAFYQWEFNLNC